MCNSQKEECYKFQSMLVAIKNRTMKYKKNIEHKIKHFWTYGNSVILYDNDSGH
jgi:hypothetical protein